MIPNVQRTQAGANSARTLPPATSPRETTSRWWLIAGGVWLVVFAALSLYRLEDYPVTWFDEGSHLHVPKALVQHGVYADPSSEGYRYFGPAVGVGPTVMLPIAGVFGVAGIGLLQARVVMALYLIAAMALLTVAAWRLFGLEVAIVASMLAGLSSGVNMLYLGRQALGEVPALAFTLLGIVLWWRSLDAAGWRNAPLWASGVAFGLAGLTKNQSALLIAATLAALYVVDRVYYRKLTPLHVAVPLAGVVGFLASGYLLYTLLIGGAENVLATLRLMRDASAGAAFTFSPGRLLSSLKFLAGPDDFGFWGLPGLAYGLVLSRRRDLPGLRQGFVALFVVVGLAWYSVASIGWTRYAFPALAVNSIFVAKLVVDVVRALATSGEAPAETTARMGRAVAVSLGVAVLLGYSLQAQARPLIQADDRTPQAVARFLDLSVSRSEVIETWETELGFLTDHRYHYPPSGRLDLAVRSKWQTGAVAAPEYDPIVEARPDYLVVGPFAKYTGIYDTFLRDDSRSPRPRLSLIAAIGQYDVYRLDYK